MSDYNGWKNQETWNVALWIRNDEGLYHIARDCDDYCEFISMIRDVSKTTNDGISWEHPALDLDALDEMIQELS